VSDLTTGSIPRHLVRQALPMMLGMLFQTLYYLIDLWFVARLGDAAVAGVSAAGNVQFIVMALTQVLAVGTMALIAHAVGRRDMADATVVFNQSTTWALACGALTLVLGYALGGRYLATVGSDPAVREAGMAYLRGYLPGLALQFAFVSMSSALRDRKSVV
jgi:Na+-driven multidrug efflux pump